MARIFPKTLLILGRTWRISHTKKPPPWITKSSARNDTPMGEVDEDKYLIWIRNTDNIEEDLSTLAHELLHVFFPNHIFSDHYEEGIVSSMEHGFYTLLTFNDLSFFRLSKKIDKEKE